MKRAQIESGELIMVIVIVMILLIGGLVIYSSLKTSSIEQDQRDLTSVRAVDLAIQAVSTPELKCNFAVETGELCVDIYRMNALLQVLGQNNPDVLNYFRSKFGPATITVSEVYPGIWTETIYDAPLKNARAKIPLRIPIKLYDATTRTYSFGVMEVIRYG